jgi:hypothetical protein
VVPFVIAILAGTLMLLAASVQPTAADVLGGGQHEKDCRAGFVGVDATHLASGVVCADGDPACDMDEAGADGVCRFVVSVCAGLAQGGCAAVELDGIAVAGLSLSPPALPVSVGCGEPQEVDVPVGTAMGATLIARTGREVRDVDYLNLCCVAEADALSGPRCAAAVGAEVSGCGSIPRKATRGLAKAAALLDHTAGSARRLRRQARKARRQFKRVRAAGRRLAKRGNECGFSLGLMGTHGLEAASEALP